MIATSLTLRVYRTESRRATSMRAISSLPVRSSYQTCGMPLHMSNSHGFIFADRSPGECYTTLTSSPIPISFARSVGSPRVCPHSRCRRSVLGHDCVPVVSLLAGASGKPWPEYWLHLILHLQRMVLQRGCIHQGSYRESFTQDSYPKKWTKTKEESMVDT